MKVVEFKFKMTSEEILEFINQTGLAYIPTTFCGCDGFFIPTKNSNNCHMLYEITITKRNKDICIIYPYEILYIAIEDRKSVLYLVDRKIETSYHLNHWKDILDKKHFAQPHYSYIVNLNYVYEVTKDFVTLKYGDKKYRVYTSSRKISSFKKSVLELRK